MAEEFGDFSHHRPVTLPDGTRHLVFLGGPDHDTARAAALALASNYFDQGYDTIGWKVSEATGYEDPTWASAYMEAKRRQKRFVGYHYDRAAYDGATQFDWFISRWLAVAGTLRPGLDILCDDVEDTSSPAGARTSMLRFVSRGAARGYPSGVIYSGVWYARPNNIRLDDIPVPGWRRGWLSDYTAGQADGSIELPPGWPREWVTARQYTSTHPWPGLAGGVDFNRTLAPWPAGGDDMALDSADKDWLRQLAAGDVQALSDKLDWIYRALARGEVDGKIDPSHRVQSVAGVYDRVGQALAAVRAGDAETEAAVDRYAAMEAARDSALAEALRQSTGGTVDLAAVRQAAEDGAQAALERVRLTVEPQA